MKRLLFAAFVLPWGSACAEGEEYTPLIHVTPGAAARAELVHHGPPAPRPTSHASRVHAMVQGEELVGASATGHAGDLVMENDEVVFVVVDGAVVDAADAHGRADELGGLRALVGGHPVVSTATAMTLLEDGTALVRVRGRVAEVPGLVVSTRFTLHKTDRAMLLETTVENTSPVAVTISSVGDEVRWGATHPRSAGAFVAGVGDRASYALTSTEGTIDAESTVATSVTRQLRAFSLDAGKSVSFARVFLVGPRPDVSGLVAELTKMSGGKVGSVRVTLEGEGGAVELADATLEIDDAAGHALMDLRAPSSELVGELPPGRYGVRFLRGGAWEGQTAPVEVVADREAQVHLRLIPPT